MMFHSVWCNCGFPKCNTTISKYYCWNNKIRRHPPSPNNLDTGEANSLCTSTVIAERFIPSGLKTELIHATDQTQSWVLYIRLQEKEFMAEVLITMSHQNADVMKRDP
jgi:hypothetical protein